MGNFYIMNNVGLINNHGIGYVIETSISLDIIKLVKYKIIDRTMMNTNEHIEREGRTAFLNEEKVMVLPLIRHIKTFLQSHILFAQYYVGTYILAVMG